MPATRWPPLPTPPPPRRPVNGCGDGRMRAGRRRLPSTGSSPWLPSPTSRRWPPRSPRPGHLSALPARPALAPAARLGIPATIVVLHNDGGGIFHFLPQADLPEHFERHWGAPPGRDFVRPAG